MFVNCSSTFRTHHNKAPRVTLDYATYEGTAQSTGINEFLGMRFADVQMCMFAAHADMSRYAAAPLGDLRFRKPATPKHETGVIAAKEV